MRPARPASGHRASCRAPAPPPAPRVAGIAFWAVTLGLVLLAAPSAAVGQVQAAVDLGYSHDHVWRGLTRVTRPSFEPAVAVAWKGERVMVSAGGWALLEPWEPDPDHLTVAGRDAALGEADAWVEGGYRLRLFSALLDLRAGWTLYTFHGDAAEAGPVEVLPSTCDGGEQPVPEELDTSEAYVGVTIARPRELYTILGLPPDLPIGFDALAAFDLGPVGGTYLETGLRADLPVLFIGEPLGSVVARLISGWSINQASAEAEPGWYAGEGLTHVALSLGATPFFQPGGVPLTIHAVGTLQAGVDAATRRRGPGPDDEATVTARIDVTLSFLFPLRRAP